MSEIIEAYKQLNERLGLEPFTLAGAKTLYQVLSDALDTVSRIEHKLTIEQYLAPQTGYVWLYTKNRANVWGDKVEVVFESFGAVLEHIKDAYGNDSELARPENWRPLSPLSGTGYFECHAHSVQRLKLGETHPND